MNTSREIKQFFHNIKLEKLQHLHEIESIGDRNQQLEQEQEQEEPTPVPAPHPHNDEIDLIRDSEQDMFDSNIISSVLQEIEDDEESFYSNEFKDTDDLFFN